MPRGVPELGPKPRHLGHGMTEREAEIMALREVELLSPAEIAAQLELGEGYIKAVIGRYTVSAQALNAFDQMSKLGSMALLEAIKRHHPEMVR